MLCFKYARRTDSRTLLEFITRSNYSRRSDKSTITYKVVQANGENLEDVDDTVLGINSNWELLTPRGFRFYLPGSIGPGWSDVTTTARVKTQLVDLCSDNERISVNDRKEKAARRLGRSKNADQMFHCVAQECPLLLRKGIEELFKTGYLAGSSQFTIITVSQSINPKVMRWNKEMETERLAKRFVLAASDICVKLVHMGYWADFINPFSGQPHLNFQKKTESNLYKTDERFRCLGFKILHRNNCKVILHDNNVKNFLGSLYTTAPSSTEFLKEILRDCEFVHFNEA